jgi:hypothetical protein
MRRFDFGIPLATFDAALLWKPKGSSRPRLYSESGKPVFPSWSWLGWEGQAQYGEGYGNKVPQKVLNLCETTVSGRSVGMGSFETLPLGGAHSLKPTSPSPKNIYPFVKISDLHTGAIFTSIAPSQTLVLPPIKSTRKSHRTGPRTSAQQSSTPNPKTTSMAPSTSSPTWHVSKSPFNIHTASYPPTQSRSRTTGYLSPPVAYPPTSPCTTTRATLQE